MGFTEQRGDALNLVNAVFSQPQPAAVESVPFLQRPDALDLAEEGGKAAPFLLLTAIVVFGVLRPAVSAIGTVPVIAERPPRAASAGGAHRQQQATLEGVRQIAKSHPAASPRRQGVGRRREVLEDCHGR